LAETAAQESTLESMFEGNISLTVGTVADSVNGDNNTYIMTVLDNITGQTIPWLYTEDNEMNHSLVSVNFD